MRSKQIDLKTYLRLFADNWKASYGALAVRSKALLIAYLIPGPSITKQMNTPNAGISYYGKGDITGAWHRFANPHILYNKPFLDNLIRLIWHKHSITLEDIAENGLNNLLVDLLGEDFSKIWADIKTRYIFGAEDIPLPK